MILRKPAWFFFTFLSYISLSIIFIFLMPPISQYESFPSNFSCLPPCFTIRKKRLIKHYLFSFLNLFYSYIRCSAEYKNIFWEGGRKHTCSCWYVCAQQFNKFKNSIFKRKRILDFYMSTLILSNSEPPEHFPPRNLQ